MPNKDTVDHWDTINAITFNRNKQLRSEKDRKAESNSLLKEMTLQAEELTPNDALLLAQRLLVGINNYGIKKQNDFKFPETVETYVRRAIRDLRGLSMS